MINVRKRIKLWLFLWVLFTSSFLLSGYAQARDVDQIGYPDLEYNTLESFYERYRNDERYKLLRQYYLTIYNSVRSVGLSPKEISLPRPTLIKVSDSHKGIILPLIQVTQREKQRHIILNITQARTLAEAWHQKFPQGPSEVLGTYVINAKEFGEMAYGYDRLFAVKPDLAKAETDKFRNNIPKHLVFVSKLVGPTTRNEIMPPTVLARYRIEKCVGNTLPFLDLFLKDAFNAFLKNQIQQDPEPTLIKFIPECVKQ
ncbi:hypothetical protein WH96_05510 [Kiloniella spongiae]|uniref:DUF547 domain-containing protein n=1 Tax=Kiloniella spongiae TaxID=1489064 RepID=A0A0H2MHT2_9PROT|nr:hypothetical protein [Kiloniella spongiae]KLN61756.1 hypothetical protein WH96_05510 [Kiloniella spongiae]